jgi:hypothetical protein
LFGFRFSSELESSSLTTILRSEVDCVVCCCCSCTGPSDEDDDLLRCFCCICSCALGDPVVGLSFLVELDVDLM